jgi:flagellar hook-associated protein FlgK
VNAKGPQRIVDRFLEKRLLGATSASAEANARRSLSEVANFALSEGAGAIGTALDGLESSLREVATSPGDRGAPQRRDRPGLYARGGLQRGREPALQRSE